MNLTDLRDVLDERSTTDHAEARAHLLLTGVHDRLAVRRRRRRTATVAAATVAVTAVGLSSVALLKTAGGTPTATPLPTPTIRMIAGFPEYADGARVIAAREAPRSVSTVSVTFTPTTLNLVFFERCLADNFSHRYSINGHVFADGDGSGCSTYRSTPDDLRTTYGVKVGQPATVTFTTDGVPTEPIGLAVGEEVEPARYPFPPRPATLQPLEHESDYPADVSAEHGSAESQRSIYADPTDPNRPQTMSLIWGDTMDIELRSQTPGELTVQVNGVEVGSGTWWDYQQGLSGVTPSTEWKGSFGLVLKKGGPVTITVTPKRMTGDWSVRLRTSS
jgi:hypothetical protein